MHLINVLKDIALHGSGISQAFSCMFLASQAILFVVGLAILVNGVCNGR